MRNGPCLPWVDEATLRARPSVKKAVTVALEKAWLTDEEITLRCVDACEASSEVLYEAVGRVFSGECGPVTVRPVARPTDGDERMLTFGWASSWGYASSFGGVGSTNVVSHYGQSRPRKVQLGAYPVTEIVGVLINGVEIPSGEYEVEDGKWLVRMRTSENSTPTEMPGWPTAQIPDLPDSEPGTFSVTFKFGQPPPRSGVIAAEKLAELIVLPMLGDDTKYPVRVTSMQRQGVTAMVTDVLDLVMKGAIGVWEVDLFVKSINPKGLQRQATVWSPDAPRARRVPSTTYRP